MPLTRNQADAMIRRLTLTFEGTDGDLNITYRPNLLSRAEFRRLKAAAEGDDDAGDDNGIAPLLCRAILGGDFLQDDGQPFPIDVDSMALLGYPVQQEVIREMLGSPTPTNGRRPATSSAERRLMPPIEHSSLPASEPSTGESMRGY